MKPQNDSALVLGVAGLLGLRLGWVAFPDWQVAVETAQVVAGVVRYPSPTPFLIYHLKLWTILHQLLAAGLKAGLSEISLSLVLSAIIGMLSLQALSLVVYALSGDALVSIGASLVIYFSRASELGVTYPIYLMGSTDTYGMFGLSFLVLVAGLFGAGFDRSGLFLAGVAPAVHPSLGFGLLVVLAVSAAWDRESARKQFAPNAKYFLAGLSLTVASGLLQANQMRGISPVDGDTAGRYLTAFVQLWDVHRAPVPLVSTGVAANACVCALAILWLTAFSSHVTASATLLLRLMLVAGVLSLAFAILSWAPPDVLPQWFLILMPSRLLNMDAMMAPAFLIGLIASYRQRLWSAPLLLALFAGIMLGSRSMFWTWLERHGHVVPIPHTNASGVLGVAAVALVAAAALARLHRQGGARHSFAHAAVPAGRFALAVMFMALAAVAWGIARPRATVFADRTTDPLFRSIAERRGILLTAANLHLVQLRTRRPVLVDGGGLDGLPYALESAVTLDRILREVYRVDFFRPPDDAGRGGRLPVATNQVVWERFTVDDWKRIRRTYGTTDVVTWADWTLALPVVAENQELRLYSIPD